MAVFGLAVASGQTQDTSGNGMLKGNFAFRHVAVLNVDENYDPAEIAATYGTIVFDGAGHYSVTATTMDNTVSGGASQILIVSGTYAIGSNGAGYVSNPLYPTDYNAYIWGAVAQGVYTGSSTESDQEESILNDVFIAIPAWHRRRRRMRASLRPIKRGCSISRTRVPPRSRTRCSS